MDLGNRGLIPFITLNDVTIEDSQNCIEYLCKVFDKDLNSHLTNEQKDVARAIQMYNEKYYAM
jgi:hypothetical protein